MAEMGANLESSTTEQKSTPVLRLGRLRSSGEQSSLKSLFSNLRDFLVERPVKLRPGDSKAFNMPGFGTGFSENLKEFFHAGPRGVVRSDLLVNWSDVPGGGGLWQNIQDLISPKKLPPLKTTS